MSRTCLRAAGALLLLLATSGRADQPLGTAAEEAAKSAHPGLKSTPARVQQATSERNVTVRLLQERLEAPANVTAGEVTFAVTNAGTETRGFKVSGPGLQRELHAPLPPGQTKTLAVNLRSGVYHLEAPARGGSAKALSAELTVRNR
ncbi:MAG: hypothetical protein JO015_07465 [Verrucomicrobia bacterium]|nr:hypothetical protein [Verrucomicrobiota bacterium]